MKKLSFAFLLAFVAMSLLVQAQVRLRFVPTVVSSGGVGCNGTCDIATSFLSSEGWTTDASQWIAGGGPCTGYGVTFTGVGQTGFSNFAASTLSNPGGCDVVIAAANNPNGSGGRGFRHMRGDGVNGNSGGMSVSLPSGITTIINVRYWERWSSGFHWSGGNPSYSKDLYWHDGGAFLIFGYQTGGLGNTFVNNAAYGDTTTVGWSTRFPGGTADGTWSCHETQINLANGHLRHWYNGTQVYSTTTVNFGSFATFSGFTWGDNQSSPDTCASPSYCSTDWDDLKITHGLAEGDRIGGTGC